MDFAYMVPISLFVCITLAIKFIADSLTKRRMIEESAPEDLVRAMLQADEVSRRLSALKWGIVLTALGGAFGLVGAFNLDGDNPSTWGLLIGAAGIGMLVYHAIASRAKA